MMIAAEFQLTSDDYVEAQNSHARFFGKWLGLGALVLGAALAITVLIAGMDPTKTQQMIPVWVTFGAMLLVVILVRFGTFYRMQFNRLKGLHAPIHFEAGDAGVVYRTSKGESTTKWEGFENWAESKGSFRLYVQPRLFFVVPKRVLDGEQVAALRELLRSRVR
jgi:hypothetical protein